MPLQLFTYQYMAQTINDLCTDSETNYKIQTFKVIQFSPVFPVLLATPKLCYSCYTTIQQHCLAVHRKHTEVANAKNVQIVLEIKQSRKYFPKSLQKPLFFNIQNLESIPYSIRWDVVEALACYLRDNIFIRSNHLLGGLPTVLPRITWELRVECWGGLSF